MRLTSHLFQQFKSCRVWVCGEVVSQSTTYGRQSTKAASQSRSAGAACRDNLGWRVKDALQRDSLHVTLLFGAANALGIGASPIPDVALDAMRP